MVPSQLTAEQFSSYPEQAKQVATVNVELLRQLPLAFVPLLLRELVDYDWKFPMERAELDRQLAFLRSLKQDELRQWMTPFAQLKLSADLEHFDWVNVPADFSERLTAHLWATHQIDAFRAAAVEYVAKLNKATAIPAPSASRMTIVIVGEGVTEDSYPLFRKLRPHGTLFTAVDPADGNKILLEAMAKRAEAHPLPFGHWYIDGGALQDGVPAGLTSVSYESLAPIRAALLHMMEATMRSGSGAEALRTKLARLRPEDLGVDGSGDGGVIHQFAINLLTQGSGTQVFSTTFVQWAAREALRRAQPLSLLARYAPRQTQESMNEMLAGRKQQPVLDPKGSLVDADMGAYYTWGNQQRLAGAATSSFLAWFEGHREALAIGPSLPRGKVSNEALDMKKLIARIS